MNYATFYKNSQNGEIIGFKTEGHAGYADKGNDVVCAAISMLVINTINSIEMFTVDDCEIIEDENNAVISLMADSQQSIESRILLKSLELGLNQVAQGNPDYLSIKVEEV